MKKNFYAIVCLFFPLLLFAQNYNLPHWETQFERQEKPQTPNNYLTKEVNPTPPPIPVRTMAEWEEVQGLVLGWRSNSYHDVLTEIVRNAIAECTVYIVTDNLGFVMGRLANANIPTENIRFIVEDLDSVWIRDYGPWTVYQNDVDSISIVDWIYNRPFRPDDDKVPTAVAEYLNYPVFEATQVPFNWVHTGGNHLRNGMNTAFSSDLVLRENPGRMEREINDIAQAYLGVDQYIKFRRLPYDGIHHIDMHMCVIDEETIFFGQYPEGVADGPQIEENIAYLRNNFLTPFGNTYNVLRLPMPPDSSGNYPDDNGDYRTYTNSLFINKTIIVPIYEEQYDTTALRIYRETMPGYNVVGIDCNEIIEALGALHCITKLIGVPDPLRIAHPRLRDTYDAANDYPVQAIIQHRSGIEQATLYYRTETGGAYSAVPMTLSNAAEDIWIAAIPAQAVGTRVEYYIQASAVSGKEQVRPLVAPEGYFYFNVKGYDEPPVAQILHTASSLCSGNAVTFRSDAQNGITALEWIFPGGNPATSTETNPTVVYEAPGTYDVTLIVSNPVGADTLVLADEVQIEEAVPPFSDDFTSGPNPNWQIDNPDNDEAEWEIAQTICYGNSFMIDNRNYDSEHTRDYFSTRIDLSGLDHPAMTFDVAYARRIDNLNRVYYDELRVNVIRCNGEKINVYNKSSDLLATVADLPTTFTPVNCSQWRNDIVYLGQFTDEIVKIEFEAIGGDGNRLYLDNINIVSSPNQAPTVFLEAPEDGRLYEETVLPLIPIKALAGDIDGSIDYVTFFVNGDSVGIATAVPYIFPYDVPAAGLYEIQARATDNDGAETYSATHQIEVALLTNTQDQIDLPFNLKLFPNPVADQLYVSLESSEPMDVSYQLITPLGQRVAIGQWRVNEGNNYFQLDMNPFPSGVYSLLLRGENWTGGWKVMRTR